MSKDKPEVGDVWELLTPNERYTFYIIDVNVYACDVIVTAKNKIWCASVLLGGNCKYLGKSKVNIDELFEVREKYDA